MKKKRGHYKLAQLGASLMETALLVVLISIAVRASVKVLGDRTALVFINVGATLDSSAGDILEGGGGEGGCTASNPNWPDC